MALALALGKIQSQGLRFRTFFSLTKIMKRTHGLCLNKETRDEASWQQEPQENANRHNLGHVCCSWPTSAVANSNNKNEKTRDTNSSYINDMSKKSNSNDNAQNNLILIISEPQPPHSSELHPWGASCRHPLRPGRGADSDAPRSRGARLLSGLGLGFRVWGLGFKGLGLGIWGLGWGI